MGVQKSYDDGSLGYVLLLDQETPDIATPDAAGDHASATIGTTVVPVLRRLDAPPSSPATGDRYLVNPGATGAWDTKDNQIAQWGGAAWAYETNPGDFTTGDSVLIKDEANLDGDKGLLVWFNGSTWGTTFTVIKLDAGFEVVGDATGKYVYIDNQKREVASNTLDTITVSTAFSLDIRNSDRIDMLSAELGALPFQIRWSWPSRGIFIFSSFTSDIMDQIKLAYLDYVIDVTPDKSIKSFSVAGNIAIDLDEQDKETHIAWGVDKATVDPSTWSGMQANYQWALHAMNAVAQKAAGANGGQYDPITGKFVDTLEKWDSPQWIAADDSDVPYEGAGTVIAAPTEIPAYYYFDPEDPSYATRSTRMGLHKEFSFYREFDSTQTTWSTQDKTDFRVFFGEKPLKLNVTRVSTGTVVISSEADGAGTVYVEDTDYTLDEYYATVKRTPASSIPDGNVSPVGVYLSYTGLDIEYSPPLPTSTIWAEDPASDEVDALGGVVGYNPLLGPSAQPPQSSFFPQFFRCATHLMLAGAGVGSYVEFFLGALCARGVGLKTDASGVANDPSLTVFPADTNTSQPVPKGTFPEKDGVSKIVAGNGHIQLGPFDALVGRMRGIAPCAKVICYSPGGGGYVEGLFLGFDNFSAKIQAIYRAIEHKAHIFVEPFPTFYGGVQALSETELEIAAVAQKALKHANVLYVAPSSSAGFNTGQAVGEGLKYLWGDVYNTVFVGGHGPRYYNPNAPDLDKYDPSQYEDPPQRENNLFRPAMAGMWWGPWDTNVDPNTSEHPTVLLGLGSGLTHNRDFVVPQGSNDCYLLAEAMSGDPWTQHYEVHNSSIYGCTPREGLQEGWGKTDFFLTGADHFIPVKNIGHHSRTYAEGVTAAHAAGGLALAIEAYKRENGTYPKAQKVKSAAKKKARDGVGPEVDDVFITFDASNEYMKRQIKKSTGAFPIVPASRADFQVFADFKRFSTLFGSNPFGFPGAVASTYPPSAAGTTYDGPLTDQTDPPTNPGVMITTTGQILNAVFFNLITTNIAADGRFFDTWYFPSFPADRPGKDLLLGNGAYDIKETCDYLAT